eukprot:scaffold77824_cov56-Attheya_sp.AAC.1
MSNKVWVTWKGAAGDTLYTQVTNLHHGADVDDLREKFVTQQRLDVGPATLSVSTADGINTVLSEDATLKSYWVTSSDSAAQSGPGKRKSTALVVTFPPRQQDGEWCCVAVLVFIFVFNLLTRPSVRI